MPRYAYHGVTLDSALALPGLRAASGSDDAKMVRVLAGDVPDSLPDARAGGILYQLAPERCLLALPGVGRYLVGFGGVGEIRYALAPEGDERSLAHFLLSWAFPALLHSYGWLPLHASAVETSQGAVVLCGAAGVGKSTLAAAFHKRGCRLVADDMVVIRPDESGRLHVLAGSPVIHLWKLALRQVYGAEVDEPEALRPRLPKYALPVGEQFCDHALPLAQVYALNTIERGEPQVKPIPDAYKLPMLMQLVVQRQVAADMGKTAALWQAIAQVTEQASIRALRLLPAPRGGTAALVDLLEQDWQRA